MGKIMKLPKRIADNQGSSMLVALMVLFILSIMATMVITAASMENRISLHDSRAEQARQAADAGVTVARDVIMNYIMAGNSPTDIVKSTLTLTLEDGVKAEIIDISAIDAATGVITIKSKGTVVKSGKILATKIAEAGLRVNGLPNTPIRTDTLKVMGKYFASVSPKQADTLVGDLLNIQDWDVKTYNVVPIGLKAAETGQAYGTAALKDNKHTLFTAANSTYTNTWWVDYQFKSILGIEYHDIDNSTLHIAPYWKPKGILDVIKSDGDNDMSNNPAAEIAVRNWDNNVDEMAGFFDYSLPKPKFHVTLPALTSGWNYPLWALKTQEEARANPNEHIYYPSEALKSKDFLGKHIEVSNLPAPLFTNRHLQQYGDLAQSDTANWQYITSSTPGYNVPYLLKQESKTLPNGTTKTWYRLVVDDPALTKTKFFIDIPATETALLDFTTVASYTGTYIGWPAFDNFVNTVLNSAGTFFNRFKNELVSVIAVSPATLEVGYDSLLFEGANPATGKKPYIFLLSGQDVNLNIEPSVFGNATRILPNSDRARQIRTYVLAGRNVNIVSTPEKMTFQGVIAAGGTMKIRTGYFSVQEAEGTLPIRELEKRITIIKDETIINDFPEPWSYIGVGPIVSYKYL